MSFGYHTPESLLERSDSKNPATTCKGITAVGRPCRRALAANNTGSLKPYTNVINGVVAILDAGDAAAFFCWQHKEQAEVLVTKLSQRGRVLQLKESSSIDDLVARIGIIELEEETVQPEDDWRKSWNTQRTAPLPQRYISVSRKRSSFPSEWQKIPGPFMRVPEDLIKPEKQNWSRPIHQTSRGHHLKRFGRSNLKFSWACCLKADDEDLPPPKPRAVRSESQQQLRRPVIASRSTSRSTNSNTHSLYEYSPPLVPLGRQPIYESEKEEPEIEVVQYPDLSVLLGGPPIPSSHRRLSSANQRPKTPKLPPTPTTPHAQTATYLSLIPKHLSPSTTSALLSELSKPISPADEHGYIYMFWLTSDSEDGKPDKDAASSLLDEDDISPPSSLPRPTANSRAKRTSNPEKTKKYQELTVQALQRFASIRRDSSETKKILLKIGRTSNVHRRLSQWTKQCSQNITLIRYYPHQPRSTAKFPGDVEVRHMVPHVHRVERLVHLELADQRVAGQGKCEQCGREHREWFEVDASRDGVKAVDEIVKRWVGWAERVDGMFGEEELAKYRFSVEI